jgi:hypothetical protein
MEGTIWLDAHDNTGKNTKEMISTLACELGVCETLLTMGYKFSNRIKLDERKAHLEDRIASLERQLKLEMGHGGHRGY